MNSAARGQVRIGIGHLPGNAKALAAGTLVLLRQLRERNVDISFVTRGAKTA